MTIFYKVVGNDISRFQQTLVTETHISRPSPWHHIGWMAIWRLRAWQQYVIRFHPQRASLRVWREVWWL